MNDDAHFGALQTITQPPGRSDRERWLLECRLVAAGWILLPLVVVAGYVEASLGAVIWWTVVPPGTLAGCLIGLQYVHFGTDARRALEHEAGYTTRLTYDHVQDVDMIDWRTGAVLVKAGDASPSRVELKKRIRAARTALPWQRHFWDA